MTGWRNAVDIETLAAAYAEKGDFEKAVEWLSKALEYPMVTEGFVAEEKRRLSLYQSHLPYHSEK